MVGGRGPLDVITMGGMFTILKVRDGITSYGDPGWYEAPSGTRAEPAAQAELDRDGVVQPAGVPASSPGHEHRQH